MKGQNNMKYDWKYLNGCLLFLLLAACAQEETMHRKTAPGIAISVSAMELKGEDVQTRALLPLKPEKENMIRTLSLLVFDDEEQHYIEHFDYYRFLQVADEDNPDGKLTVNEPEYGGTLKGTGTLCAVANMDKEELLDAMRRKAVEGGGSEVLSLEEFKELSVELPYINHRDSVGLVRDIFMFGYYTGELNPYGVNSDKSITISLGRIISRLNLAVSTDEEVAAANLKYAIRLGNTNRNAYIFPGERSPGVTTTDSYFAPVELTQNDLRFYYYVGPHTADKEENATYIEIAYGTELFYKIDGTLDTERTKTVRIALCNDSPDSEMRNFDLNRNSAYRISIRLVKKKSEQSVQTRHYCPHIWEVALE